MTKADIMKDFIYKSVLPVLITIIFYSLFVSICGNAELSNYGYLFMFCGIPFGIRYMFLCPVIIGSNGVGFCIALFNIVIGAMIGGFILIWRLLVAVWYIPITVIKFVQYRKDSI